MSETPIVHTLFEPPPEQKVDPGQPNDYVGVYRPGVWITVQTRFAPGTFGRVERWQPVFDCEMPAEIRAARSGYFAIWFRGVPSENGRYGQCIREVRITHVSKAIAGRDLRADEYVR